MLGNRRDRGRGVQRHSRWYDGYARRTDAHSSRQVYPAHSPAASVIILSSRSGRMQHCYSSASRAMSRCHGTVGMRYGVKKAM